MGDALDIKRQELASNLFNQTTKEATPFSDPKPYVATPGTFTQDGQPQLDGQAEIDLTNDKTETQ